MTLCSKLGVRNYIITILQKGTWIFLWYNLINRQSFAEIKGCSTLFQHLMSVRVLLFIPIMTLNLTFWQNSSINVAFEKYQSLTISANDNLDIFYLYSSWKWNLLFKQQIFVVHVLILTFDCFQCLTTDTRISPDLCALFTVIFSLWTFWGFTAFETPNIENF